MSKMARDWAYRQPIKRSSAKFVLVTMGDMVDDGCEFYGAVAALCSKTSMNRKTVLSAISALEKGNWLIDTGKRIGRTRQVKVLRLNMENDTEIGTVKEAQNRDRSRGETVPFFPSNGPKNGQVNGPKNGIRNRSINRKEPERAQASARSPIPEEFKPTDSHRKLSVKRGLAGRIEDYARRFCLYHKARATTAADWNAEFSLWLERENDSQSRHGTNTPDWARIPKDDNQLSAWASRHGYPQAQPGASFAQYRATLRRQVERRSHEHDGQRVEASA